jgi:hypothetical protein
MKWLLVLLLASAAARAQTKYQNDFEKAQVGSVPEDFLVLDGNFTVKEEGGNKFLELPGAPLDTYGVLFGPNEKENVAVSARFFGTAKGRRYPVFDVSLDGVGGYKLRVSPGKKQLELLRGDAVKKSAPLEWQPGKWTFLKLQVVKAADKSWKVEGKFWQEGSSEPAAPSISFDDSEEPPQGRAGVSGMPYSGTPIRFDDFAVTAISSK